MRKTGVLYKMMGHSDTITGLALSPDGSYILSNSMDNTCKTVEFFFFSFPLTF